MKTIRVSGLGPGGVQQFNEAHLWAECGVWAVTQVIGKPDWAVTHLPSGTRFCLFWNRDHAEDCLVDVVTLLGADFMDELQPHQDARGHPLLETGRFVRDLLTGEVRVRWWADHQVVRPLVTA